MLSSAAAAIATRLKLEEATSAKDDVTPGMRRRERREDGAGARLKRQRKKRLWPRALASAHARTSRHTRSVRRRARHRPPLSRREKGAPHQRARLKRDETTARTLSLSLSQLSTSSPSLSLSILSVHSIPHRPGRRPGHLLQRGRRLHARLPAPQAGAGQFGHRQDQGPAPAEGVLRHGAVRVQAAGGPPSGGADPGADALAGPARPAGRGRAQCPRPGGGQGRAGGGLLGRARAAERCWWGWRWRVGRPHPGLRLRFCAWRRAQQKQQRLRWPARRLLLWHDRLWQPPL